jgi:hypothetical protein
MSQRAPHRVAGAVLCALALAGAPGLVDGALAVELITADEASLPPAPRLVARGGITRGPSVKVVSPPPDGRLRAPFDVRVEFRAHGGARIDPESVRVVYLREPVVDLTPRLQAGISEVGIRLAGVTAPPGKHEIEIAVTDSDGRTRTDTASFTVAE